MANDITIAKPTDVHPLIAKYDRALAHFQGSPIYGVNATARLVPLADLPGLIAALEATIKPSAPKQIAEILATIAVSWPFAHQKPNPDVMEAYTRQLRLDIAHFPADVLAKAVGELRRSNRFMPSISEIYLPASEALQARKAKLQLAQAHVQEHVRRAALKQAEAEREAAKQKHLGERLAELQRVDRVMFQAWSIEDVRACEGAASSVVLHFLVTIEDALAGRCAWLLRAMPAMAIAGHVYARQRARIPCPRGAEAIWIARKDLAAARALIAPDAPVDADATSAWSHPSRALLDVVTLIRDEAMG